MNRLLVSVLGFLNGFLAVVIMLSGLVIGSNWDGMPPPGGAILGGLIGLGLAAMICGLLAALVAIEKNAREVAAH
jgi:hypothetical protein